ALLVLALLIVAVVAGAVGHQNPHAIRAVFAGGLPQGKKSEAEPSHVGGGMAENIAIVGLSPHIDVRVFFQHLFKCLPRDDNRLSGLKSSLRGDEGFLINLLNALLPQFRKGEFIRETSGQGRVAHMLGESFGRSLSGIDPFRAEREFFNGTIFIRHGNHNWFSVNKGPLNILKGFARESVRAIRVFRVSSICSNALLYGGYRSVSSAPSLHPLSYRQRSPDYDETHSDNGEEGCREVGDARYPISQAAFRSLAAYAT